MAKYFCPAFGDCPRADAREAFELPLGEDHRCPCGTLLKLVEEESPLPKRRRAKYVAIGAGLAVVAAAVIALTQPWGQKPPGETPTNPPKEVLSPPDRSPGLVPDERETEAIKREADAKLKKRTDAVGAEHAADRAAGNELVKSAVAKMAQGKLDAADADLQQAILRDPTQSLASYDLAIVRVRQNRMDDAMNALEQALKAGFRRYDVLDADPDLATLRKQPRYPELRRLYQ